MDTTLLTSRIEDIKSNSVRRFFSQQRRQCLHF